MTTLVLCGQPGRPTISTSGRQYTLSLFDGFATPLADLD